MKSLTLSTIVVAALAALSLSFFSSDLRAQETTAKSAQSGPQWEYRALRIDDRQRSGGRESDLRARQSSSQDTLNQLGAEGWELVTVRTEASVSNTAVFYFKRPKS
ncbi:hypothetical protein [Haloferula sp.]|uniref:hypothetical protein n=1 Tax=Haloferula sp. TaxID=2497595 RepID=UPI00329BD298